jgi:drug/metabolite transporter (DMT)-like permease
MTAHSRLPAILQAVFVTFLWSTSWILIKIGLRNNIPALSFAGLRYFTAFLVLIPFVFSSSDQRTELKNLSRADWYQLAILGLVVITLTQGAQFIALAYLPSVMVSLLLNLSPIVVGLLSLAFYSEQPTRLQWFGVILSFAGTLIYFLPITIPEAKVIGIFAAVICIIANSFSTLLGRQVNRKGHISPVLVTFVSMGIGSTILILLGDLLQGFGQLSLTDWGIIAWLAIVNTAFAFTIWNRTQRTLTAVESSLINSLMMPQIAILAFIFLQETITVKEIIGLAFVALGVFIVQTKQKAE